MRLVTQSDENKKQKENGPEEWTAKWDLGLRSVEGQRWLGRKKTWYPVLHGNNVSLCYNMNKLRFA